MIYGMASTLVTSPDTDIDPGDDFALGVSPHETVSSHAHRSKPVVAGVSVAAHEDLKAILTSLRETL